MYKNTKKALEIILKEEYDKENPLQSFTHLNLGNQLLTVPKGETILYQGDSAEYFYILLSGHTVIMNQISFSTNDIIDYVEPPHILGLMEYINKDSFYCSWHSMCPFPRKCKRIHGLYSTRCETLLSSTYNHCSYSKFQYGSCRNTQNFPGQRYPRALPVQTGMLQTAIYMPVNQKGISK